MAKILSPVLRLSDPGAGLRWFAQLPGIEIDHKAREVTCGDGRLLIVDADGAVPGLRPNRMDHLALTVGDVDGVLASLLSNGYQLHPDYTPDGPVEIAEFWTVGVRFAFLSGPENVPIELCARRRGRAGAPVVQGLDHLGVRAPDVPATVSDLRAHGAEPMAQHVLSGAETPVNVEFLREGGLVWEVFDEPVPASASLGEGGLIGVVARA